MSSFTDEILQQLIDFIYKKETREKMNLYFLDPAAKYIIDYLNKNYDGKNLKQISRKLGYTCNWLQKVINKNGITKKNN